jgi:hypothetical protein
VYVVELKYFILVQSQILRLKSSAGILEQSMGAMNRDVVYRPASYVAWRAGTTTLFLLGSQICSKIPAQHCIYEVKLKAYSYYYEVIKICFQN